MKKLEQEREREEEQRKQEDGINWFAAAEIPASLSLWGRETAG